MVEVILARIDTSNSSNYFFPALRETNNTCLGKNFTPKCIFKILFEPHFCGHKK